MIRTLLLIAMIGMILIAGCSDKKENELSPSQQQTEQTSLPQQASRPSDIQVETKPAQDDELLTSIMKKDGRILTAEEQMREYYAQKGLSEEEIAKKMSAPYASKSRREEQPQSFVKTQPPAAAPRPVGATSASAQQSATGSTTASGGQQAGSPYSGQTDETASETNVSAGTQYTPPAQSTAPQPSYTDQYADDDDTIPQPDYSDAEPPELISVQFDPPSPAPGDEVAVIVQAVDNLSGVRSVFGIVKSPSDAAMLSFSCAMLRDDGTFQGAFTVPEHAEAGVWNLKNMRLTDMVHNSENYTTKHPVIRNSTFTVVSADSDITPPQLVGVYVDPVQAEGGQRVSVMVDAVDDKSGVARVYGVFTSPSRNARLSFACRFEPELNVFDGSIDIPADAEAGIWTLDYLRLEDTAKNPKTYYHKDHKQIFEKANIDVYSRYSDGEPPFLENIMVYPSTASYGDKVQIIVSASDNISGIQHVSGTLISETGKGKMPFHCRYIEEDREYVADIIIQEHTEVGTWQIENLIMSDKAHNQVSFNRHQNNLVGQASFEVIGQ